MMAALRIMWNHIMKNFQVSHGQCDSIIFLKTFSLECLLLNLGLADSRILYLWEVLESIDKFIIELHVLQCFVVSGCKKKQSRGRNISNFRKGKTFFISYINQVIILKCGPPSCSLLKKAFLSYSVWARREHIWKLN